MPTLQFFLTKKYLSVFAIIVAALAWVIAHAAKIQIPLGISKEDALAGLASIGTFLGVLGASPLPGGTLLKTAQGAQDASTKGGPGPALLFLLGLSALGAVGCATTGRVVSDVINALPTATAYVEDAELVVAGLETFEKGYFVVKPNADLQKKIEVGIADARTALDAGLRTCTAIADLSQSQIGPAFAGFQKIYQDVLALLGPLGVKRAPHDGSAGATPGGGYLAPDPLLLSKV